MHAAARRGPDWLITSESSQVIVGVRSVQAEICCQAMAGESKAAVRSFRSPLGRRKTP